MPLAIALAGIAASGCAGAMDARGVATSAAEPSYRILGPTAPTLDAAAEQGGSASWLGGPVSAAAARCPADMALVDGRFCVDRWEATILVREGAREVPHTPYEPLDDVTAPYRAVSRPGAVPHGYVSGAQAERACRASGKRLCTATEWVRACKGPSQTRYPYGAERRAGACNDDVRATHPVVEAARAAGIPADKTWSEGMNLSTINQLPESLAPAGGRSECVTPEGVYDLVGNLHEWVAEADGTFRGGFYMDTTQNGEGCDYQTTAHDFEYHDYSTGFRCCAHADGLE